MTLDELLEDLLRDAHPRWNNTCDVCAATCEGLHLYAAALLLARGEGSWRLAEAVRAAERVHGSAAFEALLVDEGRRLGRMPCWCCARCGAVVWEVVWQRPAPTCDGCGAARNQEQVAL